MNPPKAKIGFDRLTRFSLKTLCNSRWSLQTARRRLPTKPSTPICIGHFAAAVVSDNSGLRGARNCIDDGSGAFAAVTKVYIKAYPAFKTINTVTGKLKCHSQESYAKLIDAIIDLQVTLFDLEHPVCHYLIIPKTACTIKYKPRLTILKQGIWQTIQHDMTLSLLSFDMFTSAQAEKPAEDTLKPFDVVRSIPGCDADFKTYQTRGPSSWLDIYTSIVQPLAQGGAVVGVNLIDLSRIVMEDTMRTKVGRDKIKKYILEVPAPFIWQNGKLNHTLCCFLFTLCC